MINKLMNFGWISRISQKTASFLVIGLSIFLSVLMTWAKPDPEKNESPIAAMSITALEAVKSDARIIIRAQGTVSPRAQTQLVSEVSGSVVGMSKKFVSGGFVKKDDILFELDDKYYRAALMKAKANLASVTTTLIKEKGGAYVAKEEFDRVKKRFKSQEASDLYLHKPQIVEAQANLEYAESEVLRAEGDLMRTIVRAPYDGLIGETFVNFGQFVAAGTKVGEIIAIDYAEVRLAIPLQRVPYLLLPEITGLYKSDYSEDESMIDSSSLRLNTPKRPSVVLRSSYGNIKREWHADIVRSEGMLDKHSHTLNIIAQVKDPYNIIGYGRLWPLRIGTFVEAEIEGRLIKGTIILPRHVLRAGDNVWVIDKDNRLRNRQLTLIKPGGAFVYVQSGLAHGDLVCMTHVGNVVPGTEVSVSSVEKIEDGTLISYQGPRDGSYE